MKYYLTLLLNNLVHFNNNELCYYQGYHDISLLFMILFLNYLPECALIIQRFSEFYIKENLINSNKIKTQFSFQNCLKIFNRVLYYANKDAYKTIQKYNDGDATYIISWILSCFTHNISNLFLQLRLFDFFIINHPLSIIVLTAYITGDEVQKLLKNAMAEKYKNKMKNTFKNFFGNKEEKEVKVEEELEQANFYMHFQSMKMEEIDFEKYINLSQNFLDKMNLKEIIEPLKKEDNNLLPFFPLLNEQIYWLNMHSFQKEKRKMDYKKRVMEKIYSYFSINRANSFFGIAIFATSFYCFLKIKVFKR